LRVDSSDNKIKKLTESNESLGLVQVVCSPDGKWAYYNQRNGEKNELRRVSIDGGTSNLISQNSSRYGMDVSRDGKLIAFYSQGTYVVIDAVSGKVVRKFPVDPRMGSGHGGDPAYPHFTPDGKAFVYTIHADGADNLWAQPLDGAPGYPITFFKSDLIYDFHWSPDGKRVGMDRGRFESNVVLIQETKP
jgi:Tol biopolymer transport system component